MGAPPPRLQWPSAAQLAAWLVKPAQLLDRCRAKLGPVFELSIAGWESLVIVADPELVRKTMTDLPGRLETGSANNMMIPVVGDGSVFTLDGDGHRTLRRVLVSAVGGEARRRVMASFATALEEGLVKSGHPARLQVADVLRPVACRITWGIIAGHEAAGSDALVGPLRLALGTRAAIAAFCGDSLRPLVAGPVVRALKSLDEEINREIASQRERVETRGGLVGLLVDSGASNQQIRDNAISLLAAGADTTASAGAWLTALTLRDSEIQRRLELAVEENDQRFLDACIHEALRLGPVVEVISRRAQVDLEVDGVLFRKGVLVSPSPYLVHRDPTVFGDPLTFDPSRFLEHPSPPPHHYFPFGAGARRCLGAQVAHLVLEGWLRTLVAQGARLTNPRASLRPMRRNVTLAPRANAETVRFSTAFPLQLRQQVP